MARAAQPTTTLGWHTIPDVERILRSKVPQSSGPITIGTIPQDAISAADAIAVMNTQEDNVLLELAFQPPASKRGAAFVEMLARFSAYRIWCDCAQYDEIPSTIQGWYDYAKFLQGEFSSRRYDIGDSSNQGGTTLKTIMTNDEYSDMVCENQSQGGLRIVDTESA